MVFVNSMSDLFHEQVRCHLVDVTHTFVDVLKSAYTFVRRPRAVR